MKNKLIFTSSVLLLLALILTACNLGSTPSTSSTETANTSYTGGATEAPTVAAAATSGSACLVGTWKLTDFGPYMDSIKQNITAKSNNNVTFSNGEFSGSATFVFNADNTTTLKMDNYIQSFTMVMVTTDRSIDIPITMTVNGFSSAEYSVEGDRISFSNQDPGDMLVTLDTAGTVSTIDQSIFGEPGTIQLYQYSCTDANTLSLKVVAVDNMDLAPLVLLRAQ